jgi:hypothetical protein
VTKGNIYLYRLLLYPMQMHWYSHSRL